MADLGIIFRPRGWPLIFKVPALVVVLMISVSVVMSQLVLTKLIENQELNLKQLTETYLDGVSTALMPHVIRHDSWETFDVLDRARTQYADITTHLTLVALPDGSVLAASSPKNFPIGVAAPKNLTRRFERGRFISIDEETGSAWASRPLYEAGQLVGNLYAEIDVTELFLIRQDVFATLVVGNAFLTLLFAVGGYVAVRRMVKPIGVLSDYVEHLRDGVVVPIPEKHIHDERTEFGKLFRRFNKMKDAINERENLSIRLAEEEKLALIGKLASAMAHEVNNPLGGMGNAIETLRRHGDDPKVRDTSLGLLERGLAGIANVVRAALVTYRGPGTPDKLGRGDIEDLKFLIHHGVTRRNIDLNWNNQIHGQLAVEGSVVRQVALNLLLNACAASPNGGRVGFIVRNNTEVLELVVEDEGPGIPPEISIQFNEPQIQALSDQGGGLGAWTVGTLVRRINGSVKTELLSGHGTRITVFLPLAIKGPLADDGVELEGNDRNAVA